MKYPLFFYVAFLLGIHTHSETRTKPYFVICAFVCLTFVLCNNIMSVYDVFSLKPDSFLMMLVCYRAVLGPYFIIVGFLDYESDKINCARILREMTGVNRKIVQKNLLVYFVFYISIGLPDLYFRACISTNRIESVLVFLTGFISRSICIVTLSKFLLLCEALTMSYRQLKDDITHTYSRIAVFTMSRLRARHLEICELEKEANDAFGLRLFVLILMFQLGVLEIAHTLIDETILGKYSTLTGVHVYTLLDFFLTVLVISSLTWNASLKKKQALRSLLDWDTRLIDADSAQQLSMFAQELQLRPVVLTAAGCIHLGFSLIYNMMEIVFSYFMAVGPGLYKARKLNSTYVGHD